MVHESGPYRLLSVDEFSCRIASFPVAWLVMAEMRGREASLVGINLEEYFHRQLHRSRRVQRGTHLRSRGDVDRGGRHRESRSVEEVEKLRPEFKRFRFRETEALHQGEVELNQAIGAQD